MADLEHKLVLAIDDEITVTTLLKKLIENSAPDLMVRTTNYGTEGIHLALILQPDIILCDLMMPAPDGYEVCRTISRHEATKHIPIVIFTALNDDSSRTRSFECGASEYMTKSFDPDELIEAINRVLQDKRLGSI